MSTPFKASVLSMEFLETIWMDGMCSGASTVAMAAGLSESEADSTATNLAEQLRDDVMGMESVRSEIRQRLQGIDLGPFTMTLGGAS